MFPAVFLKYDAFADPELRIRLIGNCGHLGHSQTTGDTHNSREKNLPRGETSALVYVTTCSASKIFASCSGHTHNGTTRKIDPLVSQAGYGWRMSFINPRLRRSVVLVFPSSSDSSSFVRGSLLSVFIYYLCVCALLLSRR